MAYFKAEICANCSREIGDLEQAYVYENNVVCLECYQRLKSQCSYAPRPSPNSGSEEAYKPMDTGLQPVQSRQIPPPIILPGYAGFWLRFAANFIDSFVLNIGGFMIGLVIGLFGAALSARVEQVQVLSAITALVIAWLYFALMEISPTQGTLGKMAMRIIVTDMNGGRVSIGRATARHFAKFASVLTLFIGFIMAGCTQKKQALHDMIAGCLVVRRP